MKTRLLLLFLLLSSAAIGKPRLAVVALEFPVHRAPLLNGESTNDIYFSELKEMGEVIVVKIKGGAVPPQHKWALMHQGFYQSDTFIDDTILLREPEDIAFVRAPASMQDAWKLILEEIKEHRYYHRLVLSYARLEARPKIDRYTWVFAFTFKDADGGMNAIYDLFSHKITIQGRP